MANPFGDLPPSDIDEQLVFDCQEAAQEEMMRWSRYPQQDGSILCIRNKLSTTDMEAQAKAAAIVLDPVKVYAIRLTEDTYVRSFMQWIGVRAALEHYEKNKKPKLVLVSS